MKKRILRNRIIVLVFLCIAVMSKSLAQENSPLQNMDSLTEASHQQMLQRQAVEQALNGSVEYPTFVPPLYKNDLSEYSITDVPSPRGNGIMGYVSDPKDYLSKAEEERLNRMLFELEQKSSVEVAVVLLPSIGQEVPKNFAVDLFEHWGIGKSDTDNGLLILTIIDQRRTEFEVGYGLEHVLTDLVCFRIGTDEIVPHFKNGDFGLGLESAARRVKQFVEDPQVIAEVYSNEISHEEDTFEGLRFSLLLLELYLIICLLLSIWFYGVAYDIERSKDDFYDKYHRLDKMKFGCLQFLFPLPFLFFTRRVKRRLKKYRYAPRYSKVNGQLLKLKDEWAENHYLEVAQVLEEKLNAVRYDVWVADDQSDIMILEYEGANGRKYSDCKSCGYKTFGKKKSTVISAPSYDDTGERIDYFECKNCNYCEEKTVVISKISRPGSSSSSGSSFSSSSSSSSFGGGSSGGGGSGVSW